MSEDKKASATHYARTRAELAGALGYDVDRLTAAQELRLDNVVALKLVSDTMRAALLRGEQVDHRELLAVTDGLAKLLPKEREPEPTIDERDDPHARLMAIIDGWIANHEAEKAERRAEGLPANELEAAQMRVAELEAENARLRGEPLPGPESEGVIDPPTSAITPPSEQPGRNLRVGKQVGPDDHKVTRRKPVVDATAEPVTTVDGKPVSPGSKVPPGNWGTVSGDEAKRRMAAVNNDRSIEHKIMSEPSRVSGEPEPSLANESWRFPNPGHWGGDKGTEW
jgi:hypothetical protein